MALGGGRFTTMNKILPGSYINVITKASEGFGLATGIVAFPWQMSWGADAAITEITSDDFVGKCFEKLGFENTDAAVMPLSEIFKGGATRVLIYNLNNGVKASNTFATAVYKGTRGNDIKIKIASNVDDPTKYDVTTIVDNLDREKQTVATAAELVDNAWVVFDKTATLSATSGLALTGGTNGTTTGNEHTAALAALEQKYFNVLICDSTDSATKAVYAAYVNRMRERMGKDFQLVVYNYEGDYEGLINVAAAVSDSGAAASSLVYWVAGKSASRAFGKSNTNVIYDGAYTPVCTETQSQLEEAIQAGKFMFHTVGDDTRVLMDINSLVTYTETKSKIMANNEVIRVTDYLNNAIADLFNTRYIGNVINNETGRAHLRQDIASIQDELVNAGAIEYNGADLTVALGPEKGDVVVSDVITVNAAMVRLYMTITVQ